MKRFHVWLVVALFSWSGMGITDGFAQEYEYRIRVEHPQYTKNYQYQAGQSVYYSLLIAPGAWQKGVIMSIEEGTIIIADGNKRGTQRAYSLSELSALWARPQIVKVIRYLCAGLVGASILTTINGFQAYQQTPTLTALSTMIVGACGTIFFTIPLLIKPSLPLTSGWLFYIEPSERR